MQLVFYQQMDNIRNEYFSAKNIWKIAYPIILGSLAQDIITVVDTAFIGRLGEIELGGAAIGGIFYLAIVMIGWGFGLGVQILIARRYGENNVSAINRIFIHSAIVLSSLALAIFALIHFFDTNIFSAIIKSNAVCEQGLKFINIRIFGIFGALININFRAFYIGTSNTKVLSYTTGLMAFVNIILDYLLIFGKFHFPRLNIEGAALASIISEYAALVYFIIYTVTAKKNEKFGLFKPVKPERQLFGQIFKVAIPTMIQNFISFAAWFVFFLFVEKMGETQLAISNIVRSIYILVLVPIFGFAAATNTLVSFSIGKNAPENIWPIIKRSMAMAGTGVIFLAGIGLLIPRQIIRIYTSIDTVIDATIPPFSVILVASFFITFGFILFQAVSGTGKTNISLYIEMIVLIFYLAGAYLASVKTTSVAWVWSLEIFYGFGLGIFSLFYLKTNRWRTKNI